MTPRKSLTPLDLPAPLTEQECAAFRSLRLFDEYSFCAGYGYNRDTGQADSKDPTELLERHFDASSHALLRRLTRRTTVPLEQLTNCITSSWMRENKNDFLHNQLVVTEALHRYDIHFEMVRFINIMLGINRSPLPKNKVTRITTVEELEGVTAVYRFIHALDIESHNLGNQEGRNTFIWNKHLDRMLRADPSLVDPVVPFLREHVIGGTKKDLAPLMEYLDVRLAPALVSGWL